MAEDLEGEDGVEISEALSRPILDAGSKDDAVVEAGADARLDDSKIDNGLDLNQVGVVIEHARRLIAKIGWIPTLALFNATKAVAVASGAYLIYPGEVQEKALAAGMAVTLDFATSPVAWLMGVLIMARTGEKIRDVIGRTSDSGVLA